MVRKGCPSRSDPSELTEPEDDPTAGTPLNPPAEVRGPDKPIPVEVREPEPKPWELYQRLAGTVLPPLATAGIVAKVFPIGTLRSRLRWLAGCEIPPSRHRDIQAS